LRRRESYTGRSRISTRHCYQFSFKFQSSAQTLEGDIESPFWAEQHRIMQDVRNEYLGKIDSGWRPGPECRGFHDFIPEVELKPAPKPVAACIHQAGHFKFCRMVVFKVVCATQSPALNETFTLDSVKDSHCTAFVLNIERMCNKKVVDSGLRSEKISRCTNLSLKVKLIYNKNPFLVSTVTLRLFQDFPNFPGHLGI